MSNFQTEILRILTLLPSCLAHFDPLFFRKRKKNQISGIGPKSAKISSLKVLKSKFNHLSASTIDLYFKLMES